MMKNSIKYILKLFMVPQLYFGAKKLFRSIIEMNDGVHLMFSKLAFSIRNIFQFNIHRIPFFIEKELSNKSIVIDCGANVGKIVKPLLQYKPTIYCFEPNPIAFQQLRKNLGISENIQLINKAVGVENKTARLFKHVSSVDSEEKELIHSVSASLLSNKPNVDKENYYEVDIIDFLDFLKKIKGEVFILKIDIEGAEVELMNAILDESLHKNIDYIFVETHENTIPELYESTLQLKRRTQQLSASNIYYNWA